MLDNRKLNTALRLWELSLYSYKANANILLLRHLSLSRLLDPDVQMTAINTRNIAGCLVALYGYDTLNISASSIPLFLLLLQVPKVCFRFPYITIIISIINKIKAFL